MQISHYILNRKLNYKYISTNCYTFYSYNLNILEIKADNITVVYVYYIKIIIFLGFHLDSRAVIRYPIAMSLILTSHTRVSPFT